MKRKPHDEQDLRDRGVEIVSRLVSMADRLTATAEELRTLLESLREQGGSDGGR